ncbi:MAG TPA: GNAT family N-acetyltransferase [Rhodothermales bacterium]
MVFEQHREPYTISTDPQRLDFDVIHGYLVRSYWSPGVAREIVERAARNSLCFGIYHGREQVGYARVVTDRTTFGYLADVFVLEEHRGLGLSKWLMECITAHTELQGFRRWLLATADAHGLYAQFGFTPLAEPHRFMERRMPATSALVSTENPLSH